jgi:hypothetical protein
MGDRTILAGLGEVALGNMILFKFGDFPMMRRLLLGVNAQAEREAARGGTSAPCGPGEFFAEHPGLYAAALAGAAGAGVALAAKALRASGPRRLGWSALAALQVVQVAGIVKARAGAVSRRGSSNKDAQTS